MYLDIEKFCGVEYEWCYLRWYGQTLYSVFCLEFAVFLVHVKAEGVVKQSFEGPWSGIQLLFVLQEFRQSMSCCYPAVSVSVCARAFRWHHGDKSCRGRHAWLIKDKNWCSVGRRMQLNYISILVFFFWTSAPLWDCRKSFLPFLSARIT